MVGLHAQGEIKVGENSTLTVDIMINVDTAEEGVEALKDTLERLMKAEIEEVG